MINLAHIQIPTLHEIRPATACYQENFKSVICIQCFYGIQLVSLSAFIFIHIVAQFSFVLKAPDVQCPPKIQICLLSDTTTTTCRKAFDRHRGNPSEDALIDNHAHNG